MRVTLWPPASPPASTREPRGRRLSEAESVQAPPLQEVGRGCPGRNDALRVRHGAEQLGLPPADVLEDHDGGDVPAAVAVVGRRPHRYQLLVEHELVALVHQLVSAADQLQVVDVNELKQRERGSAAGGGGAGSTGRSGYLVGDLGAEQPAGAAGADGPGVHVLRVGPHQVAERPLVGNLLVPLDGPDLVQSLDVGRKSAVDAEDLLIYQLDRTEQRSASHNQT